MCLFLKFFNQGYYTNYLYFLYCKFSSLDMKQCRAMGKADQDLGGLLSRLSALVLPNYFDLFPHSFMLES